MLIFLLSNNLFVIMAEKRTSHIAIGTVSGCSSGRVTKKRGKGHRLSSQAKYIVNSVHEFFEKEKAKQKATLRDRVVKRTAAACDIGVTTVIRLHKEYGDSGGILSSLKKRYDETRVQLVLNEVDVEGICKEVHEFYQRLEYPTLSSLMEKLKGNKGIVQHSGRYCVKWDFTIRSMKIRNTSMSSPELFSSDMTTYIVCTETIILLKIAQWHIFTRYG